jgi:hypothetical protein
MPDTIDSRPAEFDVERSCVPGLEQSPHHRRERDVALAGDRPARH